MSRLGLRSMRSWLLVVVALATGTGCGGTTAEGSSCDIEGLEVCSSDLASILICEEGELRLLEECGADMVCQAGAEGPICVPSSVQLPLEDQVACAGDVLTDFNTYLNALIHLLKEADNPAYELPPLHSIDWEAGGELSAEVDAGSDGVLEFMSGVVRPPDCEGGMFSGDVCVFEWSAKRALSTDEIALGTMSANKIAMSDATRYTIVDRNPRVIHDEGCSLEVTAFAMMWRLRPDEMYSLQLDFRTTYSEGDATATIEGFVIWGADAGEAFYWTSGPDKIVPVAFRTGIQTIQCDFSLRTFEVTCAL